MFFDATWLVSVLLISSFSPCYRTVFAFTTSRLPFPRNFPLGALSGGNEPRESVWKVFSDLAIKTGSINLGQGFPDWSPPAFVLEAMRESVDTPHHQYTRPAGYPPLVELLAESYSSHLQRPVDPLSEIAITIGASQALFLSLMTLLKPSDEVVLFEPFFELYLKQIKITGAVPKFVALGDASMTSDCWALNIGDLERVLSEKSRVLILNSPHNPTGKVFTLAELTAIAQVVEKFPNLVVISDEVYKFSIYDPLELGDHPVVGHHHFARLPGMWDRTITLSSCGKTFSVTGWQVGWIVAPRKFVGPIQDFLPCVQFCAPTPMQHALSRALVVATNPHQGHSSYYEWMRGQFKSKRATLETGLRSVGIDPLPSRGGFFLMGRLPSSIHKADCRTLMEPEDWQLCRALATHYGIVAIPASPFFSSLQSASEYGPMARFAFCKQDETLAEATNRLISMSTGNKIIHPFGMK